ncbi:DUF676-domain-containing protein [Moesziomyces antarcticus]|uniref:Uncharacterized protein n=2 Tax=Pseudozyma antarctica TaxID=84753 RepID=A0A5C3FQE4_PSEA2|nr:DUF676-domain-containing protein [Moesziomyces antarcticus]GAK65628.1 DUF676-domain-containing protein [Moesziomyces antarcticus]SPO46644.1 uncharacterized protein PSANT_04330 [Moesziomyces antarcticus]
MPGGNVHLVVVHHGLWGSPENTAYLCTTLARFHGGVATPSSKLTPPESEATLSAHADTHANAGADTRLVVHNSSANAADHTYDGIDWCAERLVAEIYAQITALEYDEARVTKLSLVGYSLGGLVVRYAAGLMYLDGVFGDRTATVDFKSRPEAASLSTIATPHLGILETGTTFSKVAAFFGGRILGRTGTQLYLKDRSWIPSKGSQGMCLLEALVDDRFAFISALKLFKRIDIYANAVADLTVPYRTAAFEQHDPFVLPLTLERDPDFPVLLTSYTSKTPEPKSTWSKVSSKLSPRNLPWILNPQRIPFRFPLNYAAWLGLPILVPVMIGLVLHKLKSDSKVSNKRVAQFEQKYAQDHNHPPASAADEMQQKRFARLLATVEADAEESLRELGEDFVDIQPKTPSHDNINSTPTSISTTANNTAKSELPLSDIQNRIASTLNNKAILPQVQKHLAHFDDVLNAHAVIIVRTTTIDAHKKGIPLINAFTHRFAL